MSDETLRLLDVIGAWFAGIATLGAVVLALFFDRLKEKWSRARLSVTHESDSNGDRRYVGQPFAGGDEKREEMWLRLCVTNSSRSPAKGVQIRLLSIKKTTGQFENRPGWFFKASHLQAVTAPPLFRGFRQHFDIAYLKREFGETPAQYGFYLTIVPDNLGPIWQEEKNRIEKAENYNMLDIGGEYLVRVALMGENVELKRYELKIHVQHDPDLGGQNALGESRLRDIVCLEDIHECGPDE